jgi:hypothetical protein
MNFTQETGSGLTYFGRVVEYRPICQQDISFYRAPVVQAHVSLRRLGSSILDDESSQVSKAIQD